MCRAIASRPRIRSVRSVSCTRHGFEPIHALKKLCNVYAMAYTISTDRCLEYAKWVIHTTGRSLTCGPLHNGWGMTPGAHRGRCRSACCARDSIARRRAWR